MRPDWRPLARSLHWEGMSSPELALFGGEPLRTEPYPPWPALGPGDLEGVRAILESAAWGGGHPEVEQFETLFGTCHDAAHGIAVSSGTAALELALEAAGIGPGDEVIVPAHSFVATASAVCRVGAAPVFADIDPASFNLSPDSAAEAVSAKTRALIVVHFGGVMAEMDRFGELAEERGLLLIEDAAHAHGAEWYGQRAGGIGLAGAFSFQNGKAMSAGEGGMVVSSDDELAAKARSLANAGRRPGRGWFEHFEVGTNCRMTAVQAVLLRQQLERLPEQIRRREANAAALAEELAEADGIVLQGAPDGATAQTRYLVPGRVLEDRFGCGRDRFVEALAAEGIPVRPFYPHALYWNPLFERQPHRAMDCPAAERACREAFWLPMSVFMGAEEDARDAGRATVKVHRAAQERKRQAANGSAEL